MLHLSLWISVSGPETGWPAMGTFDLAWLGSCGFEVLVKAKLEKATAHGRQH